MKDSDGNQVSTLSVWSTDTRPSSDEMRPLALPMSSIPPFPLLFTFSSPGLLPVTLLSLGVHCSSHLSFDYTDEKLFKTMSTSLGSASCALPCLTTWALETTYQGTVPCSQSFEAKFEAILSAFPRFLPFLSGTYYCLFR